MADATPDERAVLRMAIHWRRLGMLQHITREVIDQCAGAYLPAQHHEPCEPRVERALDQLVRPISETVAALQDMDDGYSVADHLLDRDGVDSEFEPSLLNAALAAATPGECLAGGVTAYDTGEVDRAAVWWAEAANHDLPEAMYNLGVLHDEQGNTGQAIHWWTKAADQGHARAMCALAHLGDLPAAEAHEWARRSREAGFDCPPLDDDGTAQE